MRLDAYVAEHWPEQSRSTWKKLIEAGHVSVNGEAQTSAKFNVDENHVVSVEQPAVPNFDGDSLPIIYEDENVIVIDKPLGILTHSKGALNEEFTVAEFVRSKTGYKSDSNRPGIVHRLDRATSGVLLCVKNDSTASMISKQFTNRTVKKHYVAVTTGIPKESKAVLDLPIGRNPSIPSTFRVDIKGKQAETYVEVVRHGESRALVDLHPKTGRTHQLRVHLGYINTPILGDPVYGKESSDRMYLHAHSLEVTLPGGERKVFTSPIPTSFDDKVL